MLYWESKFLTTLYVNNKLNTGRGVDFIEINEKNRH